MRSHLPRADTAHTRSHVPCAGHTSIEEHGTKHGRVIISRYNRMVKKCVSPVTNNSRELTASSRLNYSSQKRTLCERVHSDADRYCVVRYIEDLHGVAMDSQRPNEYLRLFFFYPSYTRTFSPCALAHCQTIGCIHYCTNISSSNLTRRQQMWPNPDNLDELLAHVLVHLLPLGQHRLHLLLTLDRSI